MSRKSPLQQVKEDFGGKDKLVEKVMGLIDRGEEEADALRKRLLAASNKKLLRLAEVGEKVKSEYGSADKLAGAVATAVGRAKDSDYVKRLSSYSPARLMDMANAAKPKFEGGAKQGVVAKAKEAVKGAVAKAAGKATKAAGKATTTAKSAASKASSAATKAKGAVKKATDKATSRVKKS